MRDITLADTIYIYFTTRAFATGVPTVLAGTPVVSAYEDGSITQITAGITLTVDFDGVVGLNLLTIVATGANGFEAGKDYTLVITTGTVSAVSVVGEVVGSFQIGRSAAAVDLANATDGLGALKALLPTALVGGRIDASVGAVAANAITATAIASNAITAAKIAADAIGASELAADAATEIGAAVWNAVQASHVTGGSFGELATEIASILVDTGTTLDTHLTDIKGATFSGATDSLEAIRDRGDAAWTTGAGGTPAELLQSTTIATLATQVSFTLTAGSSDDDAYNGCMAIITDVATAEQKAVGVISDYTGSTKTVTLSADPGVFVMAATDLISIVAPLGATQTSVDVVDSNVDAILVDTGTTLDTKLNTAQADLDIITGASGVNLLTATQASIDAIEADTNELQTDWVDAGRLDAILDAIVADTNELQVDDVPGLIAALNNLSAANVNTEVSDVLKTDTIAELSAVPAAAPTFEDAIMFLYMALRNKRDTIATTDEIHNDAGTIVGTATLSDDATTFSKTKYT